MDFMLDKIYNVFDRIYTKFTRRRRW